MRISICGSSLYCVCYSMIYCRSCDNAAKESRKKKWKIAKTAQLWLEFFFFLLLHLSIFTFMLGQLKIKCWLKEFGIPNSECRIGITFDTTNQSNIFRIRIYLVFWMASIEYPRSLLFSDVWSTCIMNLKKRKNRTRPPAIRQIWYGFLVFFILFASQMFLLFRSLFVSQKWWIFQ